MKHSFATRNSGYLIFIAAFSLGVLLALITTITPTSDCPPADGLCESGQGFSGKVMWGIIQTGFVLPPLLAAVLVVMVVIKGVEYLVRKRSVDIS